MDSSATSAKLNVFGRGGPITHALSGVDIGNDDSMIEWRFFDLKAHIYGDQLKAQQGRIAVPQGPALGLDPDPDVIRTYLLRT